MAAANAAAEMADRLGLVEVHANACITLATGRYGHGDPEGFEALADITEHCRRHRLSSRRRAVQNLAWARLEEGDIAGCNRLLEEHRSLELAGGHGLSTNFAADASRAYFDGDWAASIALSTSSCVAAATRSTTSPVAGFRISVVPPSDASRCSAAMISLAINCAL